MSPPGPKPYNPAPPPPSGIGHPLVAHVSQLAGAGVQQRLQLSQTGRVHRARHRRAAGGPSDTDVDLGERELCARHLHLLPQVLDIVLELTPCLLLLAQLLLHIVELGLHLLLGVSEVRVREEDAVREGGTVRGHGGRGTGSEGGRGEGRDTVREGEAAREGAG